MLRAAHRHSARHADEVRSSPRCGGFYCLEIFAPDEIAEWVDRNATALCPRCGVDAGIGEMSGYPVQSAAILRAMHQKWF